MNKNLANLFKQDNKRIDDSVQTNLSHKINHSIKNKSLAKNIVLVVVALIGAGIFSWNLGFIIL